MLKGFLKCLPHSSPCIHNGSRKRRGLRLGPLDSVLYVEHGQEVLTPHFLPRPELGISEVALALPAEKVLALARSGGSTPEISTGELLELGLDRLDLVLR